MTRSIDALTAMALALTLPFVAPNAVASSQDPPPDAPRPKVQKAAEWPTLSDPDKDKVRALVGQFRKPDAKLHEPAKKALIAVGDGAAPVLFQQVSDRADNVNAQLFAVLDAVLDGRHAALIAREAKKPSVELRRYLTMRMCRFVDADLLPVLQASRQDKDEATAFHGALGALALRSKEALPEVLAYAKIHWGDVAGVVADVLPAARGKEAAGWVFEAIDKAPVPEQMTGLRLLRYLATKEQASALRPFLEATDHAVKKEAVNAVRVLHGEAPVDNLPVFQVIELAKKWLQKI